MTISALFINLHFFCSGGGGGGGGGGLPLFRQRSVWLKLSYSIHIKVKSEIFLFFLIQFNVQFKIISLIETSQSIGGRNGRTPGKPPDTPASRTWLVSHVAIAGLEPTPDTAVR